jgi:fumarate hydratase class II
MTKAQGTRIESDSMGEMEVPIEAYYGASTMRASLNFPISNLRLQPYFIQALSNIKGYAAKVNQDLGRLDPTLADAIIHAATEVSQGNLNDHFVVDVFQTGSGTSTNTNANEVIANRANEILSGSRNAKTIHPNDHVNMGQSSNDVIPSAIHVAALLGIKRDLIPNLEKLNQALQSKSQQFWGIVKTGRTHLQDATPIRLGQVFLGYSGQVERGISRLRHAESELSQLAIGGTAVGTGINTHPEFASRLCVLISRDLDITVSETTNHFQAQNSLDGIVEASGSLRTVATSLYKIANDIRWMGSGPRAGLSEISLPEVQPGSSIMPGKVNPVIAESLIQVTAQVIGNDTTIALSGQGGYFELNMMMPVAAYNLLQSIELMSTSSGNFTTQCVDGIEATSRAATLVEQGLMLGTALAPAIGYDAAASIAKEAAKTGKTIREVASEQTSLSDDALFALLDPVKMVEPTGL